MPRLAGRRSEQAGSRKRRFGRKGKNSHGRFYSLCDGYQRTKPQSWQGSRPANLRTKICRAASQTGRISRWTCETAGSGDEVLQAGQVARRVMSNHRSETLEVVASKPWRASNVRRWHMRNTPSTTNTCQKRRHRPARPGDSCQRDCRPGSRRRRGSTTASAAGQIAPPGALGIEPRGAADPMNPTAGFFSSSRGRSKATLLACTRTSW